MKKLRFVIVLSLMMLILSGCRLNEPIVKGVELSEEERQSLRSVGVDGCFVFDIDLSGIDYESIDYKVEYYQKGQYVETMSHMITPKDFLKEDQQKLMWSQVKGVMTSDIIWTLTSAGGIYKQQYKLPEEIKAYGWAQCQAIDSFVYGEEIILAAIIGNETNSIIGGDIIFDEQKGGKEALKHYDHAYVLTLTFEEEAI